MGGLVQLLTAGFDPRRHKNSEREGYNLIADRYLAASLGRRALAEALLAAAALSPGQALLDLASGPGVLAQAAQPLVAPGRVVICDLAERSLALARTQMPELQGVAADAEALPFGSASFDRVLCGLGLMFFPDERLALAEIKRVLRPQGRLALSVWGEPGSVPLVECALACIARLLPPPKLARPSPCRLASILPELLAGCGYSDIRVSVCQLDFSFEAAADYWQAFLDLAGGAASGLARLPAATLARLASEVAVELEAHRQGAVFQLESSVLIATAAA